MSLSKHAPSERVEDPIKKEDWFVYICMARTGRYYVGITTDPFLRLKRHNTGDGARFARDQGPFVLAYVSDPFANKSAARIREIQIKGWTRVKKDKLIYGDWR